MDILSLVPGLKRVASTNGGEWAGPCPFCGGRDRFRAWPATGRFWCRVCRRSGDTIRLVMLLNHVSFTEAKKSLGIYDLPPLPVVNTAPQHRPLSEWSRLVGDFLADCQRRLWDVGGSEALRYLTARGLRPETIRRHGLGYNPAYVELAPGIKAEAGITIPWFLGGEAVYVKVRRLPPGDNGRKYSSVSGGKVSLYNADGVLHKRTVILTEGEFDCLILEQEMGDDNYGVATLGSCNTPLPWLARILLREAEHIFLMYDNDQEGWKGAERLSQADSRMLVAIPEMDCKDITECYLMYGDEFRDIIHRAISDALGSLLIGRRG